MATKENEEKFRAAMEAATDKYVKQQARNTIALNAESDAACAGYARIPGPDACDLCVTTGAANGFYHTKESAGGGFGHGSADDAYHPYCNCQVVMVLEKRGRLVARDPETGDAVPYDGAELVRRYNEIGRPTFSGKGGTSYRSQASPRIIEKPLDYIRSAQTAEEVEARFTEVYRQYKRMYGEEGLQKRLPTIRSVGQKRARELEARSASRGVDRGIDAGIFGHKNAEAEIREALLEAKPVSFRVLSEDELKKLGKTELTSIEEAVKAANSRVLAEGMDYENCQRAVVAYVARRRGINVYAKPSLVDNDPLALSDSPFNWRHAFNGIVEEKIPDGTFAERLASIDGRMESFGDGSCAVIRVKTADLPRGSYSHLLIAERRGGKTVFADPMNGIISKEAFEVSKDVGTSLFRVDGLKFTDLLFACCEV